MVGSAGTCQPAAAARAGRIAACAGSGVPSAEDYESRANRARERPREMALSLPLLLGSAALAPLQAPPQFAPEMLPAAQVAEAMRQITAAPNTFIVVDGNNVRGRVGFRLGKGELSALLVTWAERHQLSERVVVAWDHGQRSEALVWRGVCHGADALRLEHRAGRRIGA